MNINFVINPENKLYQKALKREIGNWQNLKFDDFISETYHEIEFKYNGKDFLFRNNQNWIDFFSQFGPFDKALILGGNNTNLEDYLKTNNIVNTIENLDIVFENESSNKINKFCDLNFIELPENKYDIIIAKSILHHLINLEHLFKQVNDSLTDKGIFVVFEYIGENKQQWTQKKIDIINSEFICEDILPGYKFNRLKDNYYNDFPFESIRSQELKEVLNSTFKTKTIELQWSKINWPIDYHLHFFTLKNNIVLSNEKKGLLKMRANEIDLKHKDNPELLASYHYAIYKKSINLLQIETKSWDTKKIVKELKLRGPFSVRIRSYITTNKKKSIIKNLVYLKNFLLKKNK